MGVPSRPVVTQAAVGAGHWAAGRRQRALAAWVSAAGFALVAWGLGTEASTRAEARRTWSSKGTVARAWHRGAGDRHRDAMWMARPAGERPVHACRLCPGGRRAAVGPAPTARLTARAIVDEAPLAVFFVLRAARAVQRRRPRIAAGQSWSQPDG